MIIAMAKKRKSARSRRRLAPPPPTLTVGIMHSGTGPGGSSPSKHDTNIRAFKDTLNTKYTGTVPINYHNNGNPHWADDDPRNLDTHAKNLVNANINLLLAAGGTASAEKAKPHTATIPIVFTSVADPVVAVPDLGVNRNMTGVCARTSELDADRLKLLHQLYPTARKFGALFNSLRSNYGTQLAHLNGLATTLNLDRLVDRAVDPNAAGSIRTQIDQAFNDFQNEGCAAVLITADPLFNNHREIVVRTGPAHTAPLRNPPAIYQWREFVEYGGLISYGPNLKVAYQLAGIQAASILDDLSSGNPIQYPPVLLLDSFELVINLTTAMAVRPDIPYTLLARADEIVV
jgi:putative ABC transport system substrate-binding protein